MLSSLGLVLLDEHLNPTFTNEEALSALGESGDAVVADLIARSGIASGSSASFSYADHTWHILRFSCICGMQRDKMTMLVAGPTSAYDSHASLLARMFRLTPREAEALELFMTGLSTKEVAARMQISPSTAKAFLRMVNIKMGVSGRAEMMSKVLAHMCGASLTCPFRTEPAHKS